MAANKILVKLSSWQGGRKEAGARPLSLKFSKYVLIALESFHLITLGNNNKPLGYGTRLNVIIVIGVVFRGYIYEFSVFKGVRPRGHAATRESSQ